MNKKDIKHIASISKMIYKNTEQKFHNWIWFYSEIYSKKFLLPIKQQTSTGV